MRVTLRFLLATAAVFGCFGIASSAHGATTGGVDFEQPLGGVSTHQGKRAVHYLSSKLAAPRHFDLAGLAGEMRPYDLRARTTGGDWSEWVEAEDGNPVYFGGADEVQLRARGFRPRGTVHYVSVSGIATPVLPHQMAVRASGKTVPRPPIVSRAEWGANLRKGGCKPRTKPAFGTVDAAVIHHTASANNYSAAEAPSIVLGICRYHRNGNGWNDIGYNALVDRFGVLYAGRAGGLKNAIVGAHAQGFNAQTTSIASIGDHTTLGITPQAQTSIVNYLAWDLAAHGLNAIGKTTLTSAGGELSRYPRGRKVRLNKIIGHRDVGLTACPGDELELEIPAIRRMVEARIEEFGGPADPTEPTDPTDPTDPGGGVTPKP